ncbi:MAG: GGDEF domain-containing response regulator [Firmicutes bacterium HGW-Firmicutes-12]|jgi:diguanylate cyclase (GGDEF)-like protein|nr:MAG: GGDEF domain-containing response regulator [Firmicutes bacterium HGW-Firmicutes-12]
MSSEKIKVLLIEDSPGDARLIKEVLKETVEVLFELEWIERLSPGIERLSRKCFDVVLLDLSLPDSHGLNTLEKVYALEPKTPIIVLTGLDDELTAVEAVRKGAQDYLVKEEVSKSLLVRSIRYSIERHILKEELRSMSLVDELTGLHNRRGFLNLAEQQLQVARRKMAKMFLIFVDVDYMKTINDTRGHLIGDIALIETAEVLKKTFRQSDIIARIGGDEFAIIAIDVQDNTNEDSIKVRLEEELEIFNRLNKLNFKLSLSTGVAVYNPKYFCTVEELLYSADKLMYESKKNKQKFLEVLNISTNAVD